MRVVDCVQDGGDNPGKPSSEVDQDLSDVVPAGTEDSEDGIPDRAF